MVSYEDVNIRVNSDLKSCPDIENFQASDRSPPGAARIIATVFNDGIRVTKRYV